MAMDKRLQWLMTELDLELMNRRMKEEMEMMKAKQNPSNFLKTSVSQIETAKAEAKTQAEAEAEAGNQNEDRINGRKSVSEMENQDRINVRKGVTEMEKQEDLHHINKKQKMEKHDLIGGRKSVSEMENQDFVNKNKKQMMETEMNQKEEEEEEEEEEAAIAMGTNDPSLPWLPPEVETPWGIAGFGRSWF